MAAATDLRDSLTVWYNPYGGEPEPRLTDDAALIIDSHFAALLADKARLDSGQILLNGEWYSRVDLRAAIGAAIDAAMEGTP